MTISTIPRALPVLLIALASCSSSAPMGKPDGGKPDAGGGGGGEAGDAGDDAGPPLRTATTRSLLGTSTRSLLLDPFVTTDTSLGHFRGILFPIMGTVYETITLQRGFFSQAPAGVAVPVASFGAISGFSSAATSVEIVAPFAGGSDPLDAQLWVSAGDVNEAPVPFDTGGKGLTVDLLPNDQPTKMVPLTQDGAPPLVFAGRQWVRFALASPAPMPQGGWFAITVDDVHASFQLQAPEVTPSTKAPGPVPPPHFAPRTARESAVLKAYAELTHRPP